MMRERRNWYKTSPERYISVSFVLLFFASKETLHLDHKVV